MLASAGAALPGAGWTYEPKYDGIRVLAFVSPRRVHLMTRNHKDKATQFPEIADALRTIAKTTRRTYILDGEIIATHAGKPVRFQQLQRRMQVQDEASITGFRDRNPVALVLFDIVADGSTMWTDEPWTVRHERLQQQIGTHQSDRVRMTETRPHRGAQLLELARKEGWEGVIAKRMDATYELGVRTDSWRKIKIEHRQEFVIGGYTEPRRSRQYFGALLLGYYDGDTLVYAGHTGGGFTHQGLADMYAKLTRLHRATSPFHPIPTTNERPHWVQPKIVVEIKFSEWTGDGRLRQPIFVGIRDDKEPHDVTREPDSIPATSAARRGRKIAARATPRTASASGITTRKTTAKNGTTSSGTRRATSSRNVIEQLDTIEANGGSGTLAIRGTPGLRVTHLGKRFFPKPKKTKGDVMRYYADIAHLILPTIQDRPLVLKRFPEGVGKESFYQQNASDDVPAGIRTDVIRPAGEPQRRFIGGDLPTLLYTIQLGAISVDPWHSRVDTLDDADYTILDLDPGTSARFPRVIRVARAVREVLEDFGLHGALKTSGATGLHVYLPLPKGIDNESARLVAQLVATEVATRYPKEATVKRAVRGRSSTAVYVDYLQNIRGKTVAGPYCLRATPDATVSTPLAWDELTDDLDPREFTIDSAPARFAATGDLWKTLMRRPNALKNILTNPKQRAR